MDNEDKYKIPKQSLLLQTFLARINYKKHFGETNFESSESSELYDIFVRSALLLTQDEETQESTYTPF